MVADLDELYNSCIEEPDVIFKMISTERFDVIEKLIENNEINVNLVDSVGNDVVTRLLKAKQYNLVFELMKKRNWNVNHKNIDGDTFGHILAHDNSCWAIKIIEQLTKKKNYIPNIKNNKGETILDKAVKNKFLFTALKVIEDKRFDSIDMSTFKKLCNGFIKNKEYGKYTKIDTLEVIVDKFEKKNISSDIADLVIQIDNNMDTLKRDIMNNNYRSFDLLFSNY